MAVRGLYASVRNKILPDGVAFREEEKKEEADEARTVSDEVSGNEHL